MINRVVWTSVKRDKPNHNLPVTGVIRGLKGVHTIGVYYDSEEDIWINAYDGLEVDGEIICWSDIEIPEEILFG